MNMNTYKRLPFNIKLAKKIQSGEIEGRIVTDTGIPVKILCFDRKVPEYIVVGLENGYSVFCYSKDGVSEPQPERITHTIYIELPEETPNQKGDLTLGKCKEGDEVWIFSNYEYGPKYVKVKVGKFSLDRSSGRRRNVTFENGFTCQELVCQTCWYENPEESPKHESKEGDNCDFWDKCDKCKLFDGYDLCTATGNFGTITKIIKVNCEKNNLYLPKEQEKINQKYDFKPFDKVLVRHLDTDVWIPAIYEGKLAESYWCNDGYEYDQCIPYEGNEHLVGTNNVPTKQ